MTGKILKKEDQWVVEYDNGSEVKTYNLCEETLNWVKKHSLDNVFENTKTVDFDIVVKGEHCPTKEMLIKNYCAKIRLIDFDTIY